MWFAEWEILSECLESRVVSTLLTGARRVYVWTTWKKCLNVKDLVLCRGAESWMIARTRIWKIIQDIFFCNNSNKIV